MKGTFVTLFFLMLQFLGHTQVISFSKLMSYASSKDPLYILTDLKERKFIINKEQKAESELFDTQINCIKPSEKNYREMYAVVLLKNANQITAVSYFTFSTQDFQNKLKEISKYGFKQTVANPINSWIFERNDALVTFEKKIIEIYNKEATRYEISIIKY